MFAKSLTFLNSPVVTVTHDSGIHQFSMKMNGSWSLIAFVVCENRALGIGNVIADCQVYIVLLFYFRILVGHATYILAALKTRVLISIYFSQTTNIAQFFDSCTALIIATLLLTSRMKQNEDKSSPTLLTISIFCSVHYKGIKQFSGFLFSILSLYLIQYIFLMRP